MELTICGLKWDISFPQQEELSNDNWELCGLTQKVQLKIFICKDLNSDLVYRTIIHELVHAYIWSYGFGDNKDFSEENVANFVEVHARSLLNDADKVFNEYNKLFTKNNKKVKKND